MINARILPEVDDRDRRLEGYLILGRFLSCH